MGRIKFSLNQSRNLYLDKNYYSEISNDIESVHGILDGSSETYGICNLVDILGYIAYGNLLDINKVI